MKLFHLPYSHHSSKVRIVLLEKRLNAELIDVSGKSKSDYTGTYNPKGLVPYLVDGKLETGESCVILEYLDEVYPVPAMVPQHAIDRAHSRWMIRFHDAELAPVLSSLFGEINSDNSDAERIATLKAEMTAALEAIEERITPAPFWLGENFGVVDATYAMSLWYSHWLCEQLESPMSEDEFPKILDWLKALSQRKSFAIVVDDCLQALGLGGEAESDAA